jgi:two-component system OmpR family response regulator
MQKEKNKQILMIEDDEELAEIISETLSSYQIDITNFPTPKDGIESLKTNIYDLVILDLSLPEIDGLEVINKIREFSNIPIIISSARGEIEDKSIAFENGADDYLPKPYDLRELVLRINSNIKRYQKPSKIYEIKDNEILEFDKTLNLTTAEYNILSTLIQNRNKIIDKAQLVYNFESDLKTVEVLIGRIRKKLKNDCIKTVRGIGYKFVC